MGCPGCHLPEIDLQVKKDNICATCKACGWRGDLDNMHKVASFIVKNPPDTGVGFDGEGGGKKGKLSREEKQAMRKGKKEKDEEESGSEDSDAPKEKKEKKDKKEKKEKKEKK